MAAVARNLSARTWVCERKTLIVRVQSSHHHFLLRLSVSLGEVVSEADFGHVDLSEAELEHRRIRL